MNKMREYHDALVRLDALVLQLNGHLLTAQTGWIGTDDDGPPDFLKPIGNVVERMDEVIPDAIKATRTTAQQQAAMAKMTRCPDCGQTLMLGNGDDEPPVYCEQCGQGWDRVEDVVAMVPTWEGPQENPAP